MLTESQAFHVTHTRKELVTTSATAVTPLNQTELTLNQHLSERTAQSC